MAFPDAVTNAWHMVALAKDIRPGAVTVEHVGQNTHFPFGCGQHHRPGAVPEIRIRGNILGIEKARIDFRRHHERILAQSGLDE